MTRAFPEFLAAFAGDDLAAGLAGAPSTGALPGLEMRAQEETNWCWAAVTQAVVRFRRHREISQEDIASEHARASHRPFVCAPPNRKKVAGGACLDASCEGSCNDPHILRIVLGEQGCYDSPLSIEGAPTFRQLADEIDDGRPVACLVAWQAGGAHVLLVSGWTRGIDEVPHVHVLDPALNEGGRTIVERVMPYSTFVADYRWPSGATGSVKFSYKVR